MNKPAAASAGNSAVRGKLPRTVVILGLVSFSMISPPILFIPLIPILLATVLAQGRRLGVYRRCCRRSGELDQALAGAAFGCYEESTQGAGGGRLYALQHCPAVAGTGWLLAGDPDAAQH